MIRLHAPAGELPLAFQQYEHLSAGTASPYVDDAGRPLRMARLDDALSGEGVGVKMVQIDLMFSDQGGGALQPHTITTEVIGTLDSQGLARVIHAQARQFTGKRRQGESPPEMFITGLTITGRSTRKPKSSVGRQRGKAKPRPRRQFIKVHSPKSGKATTRTVYRDKTTGRFTSRAVWEALKGNAKR